MTNKSNLLKFQSLVLSSCNNSWTKNTNAIVFQMKIVPITAQKRKSGLRLHFEIQGVLLTMKKNALCFKTLKVLLTKNSKALKNIRRSNRMWIGLFTGTSTTRKESLAIRMYSLFFQFSISTIFPAGMSKAWIFWSLL